MNFDKEKLKSIRKNNAQIVLINGLVQLIIALVMIFIFAIIYIKTQNVGVVFLLCFGVLMFVLMIRQLINDMKKNPLLVKGQIIKKEESLRYMSPGPANVRETVRKFSVSVAECYEIDSSLETVNVNGKDVQSYNVHYRLFDLLKTGYDGFFVVTSTKLMYATLDEIGVKSEDELGISLKSKYVNWIVGGIVLLFLMAVFLLILFAK